MFKILDQIGNVLRDIVLGLLALLWLYSFVYRPLKALFGWIKERIARKNTKKYVGSEGDKNKASFPQQNYEEQIVKENTGTKKAIENTIDDDFDDIFGWKRPTITPVPPREQIDSRFRKPEQKVKPNQNTQPQIDNKCQQSKIPQINNKPRNVSYYKISDSNIKYMIDRGVKWLYHFTNIENIDSIIHYGIIARSIQEQKKIIGKYNDPNEAGSKYISVSIEWPNYKMFYKKRIDNPTEKYVVVCISVYALTECKFKMYKSNSSKAFGASLVESASGLYFDSPSRKSLQHDKYPTDPQAELRILNQIPAKFIKAFYFENDNDLSTYCRNHKTDSKFRVASELFYGREDYEAWR